MSEQPPVGPDRPSPESGGGEPPWGQQQPGPYQGQQGQPPQQPGPYQGQPQQPGPYQGQPQQPGPYQGQPQHPQQPGPYQGQQGQPPQQPGPYQGQQQPQQPGPYQGQPQQPGPYQGQPGGYGPPNTPYGTAMGGGTPEPPKSHKGRIIALILAVVLVLAGGAGFAYAKLGGGGQQPAEALPGNAVAYWRMDIDPSVGQKIAAVRFLSKMPKSEGDFTTGDVRQKLWDAVKKDSPSMKGIDYEQDIKPWLGDRMGVTVAPEGDGNDAQVAVAVQVKDEDKAREGIEKIMAAAPEHPQPLGSDTPISDDKPAYFFQGDYVVFTPADQVDAVKKAIEDGTLADNDTFKKDMGDLGEQGIMSGWIDVGSLTEQVKMTMGPRYSDQLGQAGRIAVAVRFDSDYLELAGITRGQTAMKKPEASTDNAITQLPDDTAVAMSIANGDELVGNAWDALMKLASSSGMSGQDPQQFIDQIKQRYGIVLPDDLKTLVGSNLVIAAPDQDIENTSSPMDVTAGIRVTTDTGKAADVMGKLEKVAQDQGTTLPVVHREEGDKFLVSINQKGLDWIGKDGGLGDSDAFKLAVPHAKDAQYVAFVDVDKIEHHYLGQIDDAELREFVQAFRSVGVSSRITGDGEGEFTFRIVSN